MDGNPVSNRPTHRRQRANGVGRPPRMGVVVTSKFEQGRVEDLRSMTDVLKANAVQMERLTELIERGQGAK